MVYSCFFFPPQVIQGYKIEPIEDGEFFCEAVEVGYAYDRTNANFDSARGTHFKYCTITWKVGCEAPPCIDSGERNPRWLQVRSDYSRG